MTFARVLSICQLADIPLQLSRLHGVGFSERVILEIQTLSTFDVLYRGGLHDLGNDIVSDMFENLQIFRGLYHTNEILERFRVFVRFSMHRCGELLLIDIRQNLLIDIVGIRN